MGRSIIATLGLALLLTGSGALAQDLRPLATSPHGLSLTVDAAAAFAEALNFSRAQVGEALLDEAQLAEGLTELARAFPGLPLEQQVALARARQTWSQIQLQWGILTTPQKQAFVYEVLAFTYGGPAARRAVYGESGGSGGGGAGGTWSHTSGNGSIVSGGGCTYASIPGMSISSCD